MKVSVFCTVFNHEKYLRTALDGFINQKTNFGYEVFVHDDASTDASASIIIEYAQKYPDIIKPILQKENQYSKGVRIFQDIIRPRMTGEYVASCEGDDYWTDSKKLQKQADFLDSNREYVACVHNTKKIDLWRNRIYTMYGVEEDTDLTFSDAISDGGSCYHTSSLMYRIEYTDDQPNFAKKARGYGDYPLAIYLALSGKIRYLKDVMSIYRFGTESSWTRTTFTDMGKICKIINSKIELLNEVNEYTSRAHESEINEAIFKHRYTLYEMQGRYKDLRAYPYKRIYDKKPIKYKIKIYLKQFLYRPYLVLRKKFYSKNA